MVSIECYRCNWIQESEFIQLALLYGQEKQIHFMPQQSTKQYSMPQQSTIQYSMPQDKTTYCNTALQNTIFHQTTPYRTPPDTTQNIKRILPQHSQTQHEWKKHSMKKSDLQQHFRIPQQSRTHQGSDNTVHQNLQKLSFNENNRAFIMASKSILLNICFKQTLLQ